MITNQTILAKDGRTSAASTAAIGGIAPPLGNSFRGDKTGSTDDGYRTGLKRTRSFYWAALVVDALTIIALPATIFGGWMGSMAFTSKGRRPVDGEGAWSLARRVRLLLFLLSDWREAAPAPQVTTTPTS